MLTTIMPHDPRCPCCAKVLDAATSTTEEVRPSPGDLTVCIYCFSCLEFLDSEPWLSKLSEEQVESLDEEARRTVRLIQGSIRNARMKNGQEDMA